LILQKNNIFKYSSNYLILLIMLLSLVTIIVFSFHDYFLIKKIIEKFKKNKQLNANNRNETKNIIKKQNININHKYNSKNVINEIRKRNYKKKKKTKRYEFKEPVFNKLNIYQNYIGIYNINTKKYNKKKKNSKQIKHRIIKKKLFNKFYYIDAELNDLEYKVAIKVDKRTYCQYYLSLLKEKNLFLFSFITNNDYNSKIIKIYLFFYTFLIDYTVSAMFYTDSTMHEIYVSEGTFNFIYQIPQMIYSSLITIVLNLIITTLGLCQSNILKIKYCNINIIAQKEKEVLKCIKYKIINFFIITYIFLILFWIYLGCFCAVYKNTQIHLLIEVSSSFVTSLITPLFFNLLPGIFRIPSLKKIKKNRYILYKISQILQII